MCLYKCEFCHAEFCPRPQVKRPRACLTCQSARQRQNEKEWREKNKDIDATAAHRIYRQQRLRKLSLFTAVVLRSLKIGFSFLGLIELETAHQNLAKELIDFFDSMGLRQINKFWPDVFSQDLRALSIDIAPT